MAVDDVYLAMVALEDEETAEKAAAGDWSVLGELELNDEEREMVSDLIEEENSEVEAFSSRSALFRTVRYTSGKVSPQTLARYNPSQFRFGINFAGCGAGTCVEGGKKMPGMR